MLQAPESMDSPSSSAAANGLLLVLPSLQAMSAFEAFKAQARDGLMAANEGMLPKEANARLKEMWDQMGDEEKGPYKSAAKDDKERFNKEMETYHPDGEDGEHPVSVIRSDRNMI